MTANPHVTVENDGSALVFLTSTELQCAALVGQARLDQALRESRQDTMGKDSLRSHQFGAAGEMAFAKALGIYWEASCGTFKTRLDVGTWEVRTRTFPNGELFIRKNDAPGRDFALVTYEHAMKLWRVVGWFPAASVKPEWWDDAKGWYSVPRAALFQFERGIFKGE
jgi:hypothetical protein